MLINRFVLNRERLILYCDWAIIAFLCFLIFCLPFSKAGIESFVWPAIFIWILKRVLGFKSSSLCGMLTRTQLNRVLGVFIVANVLSVIFSTNFGLSLRAFFGKELKFLAIYFMLVEVINTWERLKSVLIVIIASAVLVTADALVQYFRGVDFLRGYYWNRLTASFSTGAGFAGWLIVVIPLILGMLLTGKVVGRRSKILLMMLTVLLFTCLLGTYARGAWLGFIMSVVLTIGYVFKGLDLRIKLLYSFVGIGVLSIFLVLPQSLKVKATSLGRIDFKAGQTINARIKSTARLGEGSILIRFKLWKENLKIIRDHSFIGCGLNTYSIVARGYKSFEGGGVYSHNSYLQMAAETGLFGLLTFLWILFTFFKIGLRYLGQRKDFLVLGLLSGILAYLVHAFFDTHFYSLQLVVLFWYMLGLTVAIINLNSDQHQNLGG